MMFAVIAKAEDVTFPELKEAKVIQDNWYSVFAEGKKIGYTHFVVSELKYADKDCLLIETSDSVQATVGGKVLTHEEINRALITKDGNAPLYYSANTTAPEFKMSETAKFQQKDKGWTVTVVTTLNDKSATDTVNVENNPDLCLGDALPYFYGQKMLKDKKNADFTIFSFNKKAADQVSYTYKGEKTEGEGDKARTLQLVESDQGIIWYGPDGTVERSDLGDILMVQVLTDEKTAQDFTAKWDGYKAPDCIAGDTLTIAPAGLKIHRPAPQYSFVTMFDKNVFAVTDTVDEIAVVGMFLGGVPEGTDYNDAFAVVRPALKSEFELGEGKMIDIGKTKCLSGDFKRGKGLEADSGKYYMIIHDGEMLLLMGVGAGDGYAAVEKDITKWIESIEFIKPVYDESKLLVTDKTAGLTYKLPNPGWIQTGGNPQLGISTVVAHIWTKSHFYVQAVPTQPGATQDVLVAKLSEGKKVTDQGSMKVGKYDAKYVVTEGANGDQTLTMQQVVIQRDKDFVILGAVALKDNWDKMKSDIDSILKSVEFTEEQPGP
jgi:hypothetical protein